MDLQVAVPKGTATASHDRPAIFGGLAIGRVIWLRMTLRGRSEKADSTVTEPSPWLHTNRSSLPDSQAMPVGPAPTGTVRTTWWKVEDEGSVSMNET